MLVPYAYISQSSVCMNQEIDIKHLEASDLHRRQIVNVQQINGAIRRHFGKQMNKETKLRINNITAKAALKFGSETWILKKREEQRLENSTN